MVKTKKRIKGGQEATTVAVKNPDVVHSSSMKEVPNPSKTTIPPKEIESNVTNPSYTVNRNTLGETSGTKSSHHFYQPLIDYKYQIMICFLLILVGYLLYHYLNAEKEAEKTDDDDTDDDSGAGEDDASGAADASGEADASGAADASGEADASGAGEEGFENYQNYKNSWIEGRPDLTSNNPLHLLPGYQK